MPELRTLLQENFEQNDADCWHVPDPDRQEDMEKLREANTYLQGKGRLRSFRSEAVRAGFSHAWRQRDYGIILAVADRLPPKILDEEAKLLMCVDNVSLRHQDDSQQMSLLD